MKKIVFFFILFISLKSCGQLPVNQTLGSDSTLVTSKGAFKSRLINKVFTDTTQANTQRIKFYDGAQIITITGGNKFWIRDSTLNKWVPAANDANNGLFLNGSTVQIGSSTTGGAATNPFTTDRWIQAGNSAAVYKLTMQRDVSGIVPAYPYAYTEFTRPTVINLKGVDGGSLSFTVYDSAASFGDSYPGLNWYTGYNQTLQWQLGMHYTPTDKHAFIDLKSTGLMTSFGIEYNGNGMAIFRTDGFTFLGRLGTGRTGFGGQTSVNEIPQTVSIFGSLSTTDSVILTRKIASSSSGDSVLVVDAGGLVKHRAQSDIAGGGSGEINTASNLGGGLANWDSKSGVDLRFNSFTAADFNLASNLISIDYTNGQAASGSVKGFLTSADWTTFNAKQAALSGTGILSFSGTTPSYNTTSSSIAGIISDETGTGALVFGTSPTFTTLLTTPLVKITSGSPGAGKVLTSDADGDATWETPSASGLGAFYIDGTLRAINDSTLGGDTTRFRGKLATYHLVDSLFDIASARGLQDVITTDNVMTADNVIDANGNNFFISFADALTLHGDQITINSDVNTDIIGPRLSLTGSDSIEFNSLKYTFFTNVPTRITDTTGTSVQVFNRATGDWKSIPSGIYGGSGGSQFPTQQSHTSGATVTVSNQSTNIWVIVNPASTLAALTITMPATPIDGQLAELSFGGTLTTGTVVTSLIISPNSGQTILQASTPSNAEAGEIVSYRYKSSNTTWYRVN